MHVSYQRVKVYKLMRTVQYRESIEFKSKDSFDIKNLSDLQYFLF